MNNVIDLASYRHARDRAAAEAPSAFPPIHEFLVGLALPAEVIRRAEQHLADWAEIQVEDYNAQVGGRRARLANALGSQGGLMADVREHDDLVFRWAFSRIMLAELKLFLAEAGYPLNATE